MKEPVYHIIMNTVLEKILNKFNNGKFGKISSKNQSIYKVTIESLYEYSKNTIPKMLNENNEDKDKESEDKETNEQTDFFDFVNLELTYN